MCDRRVVPDGGHAGDAGDGDDGGDVVERLPADAAFELLSDGTRIAILRALFDADGAVAFSALREAVGVADSGQFNYHLDRLRDAFVRKGADGYRLTAAGRHVVGAVLAGQYTKTVDADPVPVDADCSFCGGPLAASFEDDLVRIACRDCERAMVSLEAPPGLFEAAPRAEWPLLAERWTRQQFRAVGQGFCSYCHGPTIAALERGLDRLHDAYEAGVLYSCERCGQELCANVEASVLSHPAVVAFHHERGADLSRTPVWELEWATSPRAEVVAEDPVRVEFAIELDGDRLVVTAAEGDDGVDVSTFRP